MAIFFVFPCSLLWCTLFFLSMHFSWRKWQNKIAFFGFFQKSQNMSHGNGSSALVFLCSSSWYTLFFLSMLFSWRKLRNKITFFGFFQKSQNMSHGNGSSTFVFQVMGILKPVMVSTDKGLQLSHSPMVGCHSLYGSNFDFRMTYLAYFQF